MVFIQLSPYLTVSLPCPLYFQGWKYILYICAQHTRVLLKARLYIVSVPFLFSFLFFFFCICICSIPRLHFNETFSSFPFYLIFPIPFGCLSLPDPAAVSLLRTTLHGQLQEVHHMIMVEFSCIIQRGMPKPVLAVDDELWVVLHKETTCSCPPAAAKCRAVRPS